MAKHNRSFERGGAALICQCRQLILEIAKTNKGPLRGPEGILAGSPELLRRILERPCKDRSTDCRDGTYASCDHIGPTAHALLL